MVDRFSRREILQAAAVLCGARSLRGQDEAVFSTEVKVVNVLATVFSVTLHTAQLPPVFSWPPPESTSPVSPFFTWDLN